MTMAAAHAVCKCPWCIHSICSMLTCIRLDSCHRIWMGRGSLLVRFAFTPSRAACQGRDLYVGKLHVPGVLLLHLPGPPLAPPKHKAQGSKEHCRQGGRGLAWQTSAVPRLHKPRMPSCSTNEGQAISGQLTAM
jgi:hypothetical protein